MIRLCAHCRTEAPADDTHCPKCGRKLGFPTLSISSIRLIASLLFMGVLAFIAYVGYLLFTGGI
jgi:hypothetical protein